ALAVRLGTGHPPVRRRTLVATADRARRCRPPGRHGRRAAESARCRGGTRTAAAGAGVGVTDTAPPGGILTASAAGVADRLDGGRVSRWPGFRIGRTRDGGHRRRERRPAGV